MKTMHVMETGDAVVALSALAHASRLDVFRLLVRAGKDGMAAGEIARTTGHLPQTLSGNLNILGHAGLISSRRDGRSIIYTADYARMSTLLGFLMADCCNGAPEICAPLADILAQAACCPPKETTR
jgi:DNA-binding transcriptional ArsR family regulator